LNILDNLYEVVQKKNWRLGADVIESYSQNFRPKEYSYTSSKKEALSRFWSLLGISCLNI